MVPSEYYSGNNNLLSLYNKVATLGAGADNQDTGSEPWMIGRESGMKSGWKEAWSGAERRDASSRVAARLESGVAKLFSLSGDLQLLSASGAAT